MHKKIGRRNLFAAECENVGFSRNQILTALEAHRIVDVCDQTGARGKKYAESGSSGWQQIVAVLAHCYKMKNPDLPDACQITIKISVIQTKPWIHVW